MDIRDIHIPPLGLAGTLCVPRPAHGLVVFAHGGGSSRLSPRNVAVAEALNGRGMATLLFDLLTTDEETDRTNVLDRVRAPTLLIVGGADYGVIELNELAFARLKGEKAMEIIPGATHLFPEPGAMETVIDHAARWFDRYLAADGHCGHRIDSISST